MRFVAPATLVAGIALAGAEASADAPVPAFSLIAHYGRYPASVPTDDPAYRLIGLIYPARLSGHHAAQRSDYLVGVLLSACHAVTSSDGLARIAADAAPAAGLHFALASYEQAGGGVRSWELRPVLPRPHGERSPRWTLLRLLGCEEPETDSIEAIVDDAAVVPARDRDEDAKRFRQIGALIAYGGDFLPVMIGGAYQQYDTHRQRWAVTGIAVATAPERSGEPAVATDASAPNRIGGSDDGISAFAQPSSHVEPLTDIAHFFRTRARPQTLQEPGI